MGHYGVFSGSRWEAEIYPLVRAFIEGARAEVGRVDGLTALLLLSLDVGAGLCDDGVPVR